MSATHVYRSAGRPGISTVADLFAGESDESVVARARDHISRLCSGEARWLMSIPPTNEDSDLLLGEALDRLERAAR